MSYFCETTTFIILTIVNMPVIAMSEHKEVLKQIINRLHNGEDPDNVKSEFKSVLEQTDAKEISLAEEELIQEGMPREKIHKLCDVHLQVFKESLEGQSSLAPPGHPIHILMEEHRLLLASAEELFVLADQLKHEQTPTSIKEELARVRHLVHHFEDSTRHYLREENVLFPVLEKHGIKEPPAIMWMEHDQIRAIEKILYELMSNDDTELLQNMHDILAQASALKELLSGHFYKENNVLFPASMRVIPETEWAMIRRDFDEIGYCCFTPEVPIFRKETGEPEIPDEAISGLLGFATGVLSKNVLEKILDTLPIDITFVDENDRVRYFSNSPERIFVRSRAVLGREVQLCHPHRSIHVVNKILEDFKSGARDSADFWIERGGKTIYIRYLAVRDGKKYLGCLEVSQDISKIKNIKGEKRLLD